MSRNSFQILLAIYSPEVPGGFGQYSELCLRFSKWSLLNQMVSGVWKKYCTQTSIAVENSDH